MVTKRWEYMMRTDKLAGGSSPYASSLWSESDKKGKSAFDYVSELGAQGWELVSVCPIVATSWGGQYTQTDHLLFTFKRPVESDDG